TRGKNSAGSPPNSSTVWSSPHSSGESFTTTPPQRNDAPEWSCSTSYAHGTEDVRVFRPTCCQEVTTSTLGGNHRATARTRQETTWPPSSSPKRTSPRRYRTTTSSSSTSGQIGRAPCRERV